MPDEASIKATKKQLRREILTRRNRQSGPTRARAAMKHCLSMLTDWRGAQIGLYAGFGSELDPMPLVRRLTLLGADVGLPVVLANAQPLVFRRFRPNIPFTLSNYGIREPAESVPEIVPDIVFAPLVGVDRRGVRLGYGGGFYDRTIAGWHASGHRAAIFGLAFEAQLVSRLPKDRFDIPLDGLITEAGIRRFR